MKKIFNHAVCVASAVLFLWFLTSCQTTTGNLNADLNNCTVNLHLKDYTPKFDVTHPEFRGRTLCLSNIRNDARNTTNFSFYSKDSRVEYVLSNRANSPVQLVPSFFWYAYQKAFEHAGIEAVARCSDKSPELWIIFQSFHDEELRFKITLYENRETIYEKELTVSMPAASDRDPAKLQARAYAMIDLTIATILNDTGFKAAFL